MTSLVFTMTGLAIIAVGILLWSNTKAGKKWLRKELDGHSEEQDEQLFDGSPFGEAKNLYAYRDLKNCLDTAYMQGVAEGRHERKVEQAIFMLKNGLDIDIVTPYTSLPKEEVEDLKKSLENE